MFEKQIGKCFSSGPCAKFPGWAPPVGKYAGRSHRSRYAWDFIKDTLALQREILQIPEDYQVAIIAGSTTAAMEALVWNLLGARAIDIVDHCVFSEHWRHDIIDELKISNVRVIRAEFPKMADISKVDFHSDVVFCISSTTSGVAFQDLNWVRQNRESLTIADASSAVFCMNLDWTKLDATAFSWQKGLGGEAGLGVIVLSPRAISRLQNYRPGRAIPRIFRLVTERKINQSVFEGATINTPSMMCIEDYYNALVWAQNNGALPWLVKRVENNYKAVTDWISSQDDFSFLVKEEYRAHHIACFDIKHENYQRLPENDKWLFLKKIVAFCEEKDAGYDFLGHIMTHPHLRIWCGPTIETNDLRKFLPWLTRAYEQLSEKL